MMPETLLIRQQNVDIEHGSVNFTSFSDGRVILGVNLPKMSFSLHLSNKDFKEVAKEAHNFALST
jgi:hypothetical protein